MAKRHKVFVSYHHANDEDYRNEFDRLCNGNVLVSKSVQLGDIDPNLNAERTRQIIRDKYLRDSTVTVVLIGTKTWKRKHVDWEISSSIRQTKYNSRNGLLGILLPSHPSYNTGSYDPYIIPPRLHDNVYNGFAKIYNWTNDSYQIQKWIHEAFNRRNDVLPDNSRDLFRNNRPFDQKRWQ